ncbi:TPA: pneumococcal-type histidine triad protein [Streptococcus equi subsp. zooepidemicus]|nr:pneumococcal-type histidine triad protein [Streptococcus equi subsp. zooepidemicus]HEL0394146.1 pneumococcal-type histidine triad protein [Streptococcus equi subsp. zooepidemicus]HEL0398238.1 pneumococcal-type histidine triad protein [Streptococcus equi subsp. zooepidemicus]
MKQHQRFLSLVGLLLACNLALTACQTHSQKGHSQEPKKHQKATKKKKQKSSKTAKKRERHQVPGIDVPTDDGFLLTSESQIERKTDTGIIVKHGDHKHFFFYSDLKGTKWAYLIPKDYKEAQPASNQAARSGSVVSTGHAGDGYVFNPADIVAEDAYGYTVRHGDHYHYILKSSLPSATIHHIAATTPHLPSTPPVIHQQGGIPGLDFQTSDGFLFDGNNISGVTDTGILVKHGDHLHPISFEDLKRSKWAYLVEQYKSGQTKAPQGAYHAQIAYLAAGLKIDPSRIKQILANDGQVGFEYPHEDHTHVIWLKDIDLSKPFKTPEEQILKKIDGETFEQRKERLIKEFMDRFKVRREDISIEGNYMTISHGDHAHIYKIDPELPDDPERNVKTESTNLEVETQLVYGPFYTENSSENLTRNGVYQKYHPEGIKNIKNFIHVLFSTNSEYGDIEVNGIKTKRVHYLVRKDLDWKDLNIQRPEAIKHEGRIFKGWSAELPTAGKMDREHQRFYVDFDKVRKQPTKAVYGPGDDVSDLDLENYVPVWFTTIFNGRLKLNGVTQGGFFYNVRSGLTWKEAKEQGLVIPEPVPDPGYEFIEYRSGVNLANNFNLTDFAKGFSITQNENDKVAFTGLFSAAFGTTAPYIGPYIAVNPDKPTDLEDPSRHPNYYFHDPRHYVAVAFKAGEGGQLISRAGKGKTAVYLVRKGHSLHTAGILPPSVQPDAGYKRDYNKPIISNEEYSKPVTEDIVYNVNFDKVTNNDVTGTGNGNHSGNTWLPGDPLPKEPQTPNHTGNTGSWLEEFVGPGSDSDEDDLLAPDPELVGKTPVSDKPASYFLGESETASSTSVASNS